MISDNVGYNLNVGGTNLFIVQLVFLPLAWIISLLRAYAKLGVIKKVTADDYWMLVALMLYTVYGAIVLHSIAVGGTGKHTKDLTLHGAEISLRAWYLCEVLYAPMLACIRTSIILFLRRLAVKRWHKWIIYAVFVTNWVIAVAFSIPVAIQCFPPSYFWKQVTGEEGSCISPEVVPIAAIVHGIVSAVCDLIIGLLPIVLLWNVQINRRTKISIAALLSMGVFAGVASVVRISYIETLAISVDFLYETVAVAIWSVLEPGIGIIAGGIVTLPPLTKRLCFSFSTSKKYVSAKLTHDSRLWSLRNLRRKQGGELDSQSRGYHQWPRSNSLEIQLIEARPAKSGTCYAQCHPGDAEAGAPQRPQT